MKLRLLVLGDSMIALPQGLINQGVEFEVLCEPDECIHNSRGYYVVSTWSLEKAGNAEIDGWDAIIVGNNLGSGVVKARALPESVRDRTMIVWNRYVPGDGKSYFEMGFRHLGNWYSTRDNDYPYSIWKFLAEIAQQMQGSASL